MFHLYKENQTMKRFILLLSALSFAAWGQGQTSENNKRLKQALKQYPQADTNGDSILTMEEAMAYKKNMKKQPSRKKGKGQLVYPVTPTFKDVKYGSYERNILDFWRAKTNKPAPIFVYIHGGGFGSGSKEKAVKSGIIKECLDKGYHFASINYRYKYMTEDDLGDPQRTGLPGCFMDSARAIQFIRHNASKWNIDKEKVIVFGGSAGGGISVFLGLHDDLADPASSDPVLRESSRVFAVGHFYSQSTYHTESWPEILGYPKEQISKIVKKQKQGLKEHIRLGLKDESELSTERGQKYLAMIDMTSHASHDDPPVFIYNGGTDTTPKKHGDVVHHPRLSMHLDNVCRKNGITTKLLLPRVNNQGKVDQNIAFLNWVSQLLTE